MAILTQLRAAENSVSTSRGGKKLLQRLVRKVQYVLAIRHCIDDLKKTGGLEYCHENDIERTQSNALTKDNGFLRDVRTLGSLPDFHRASKKTCGITSKWLAVFTILGSAVKGSSAKQSIKQSLEGFTSSKGLLGIERLLDQYVADCNTVAHKVEYGVLKESSKAWISWAKKRGASCRDARSQAVLLKLLDNGRKLQALKSYLAAYCTFSYGRTRERRERLVDVVSRLRDVFNVGWFFEWPSGRHPLNSTWPWADVKPSLLVLWGVCWMFYPPYNNSSQQRPQWFSSSLPMQRLPQQNSYQCPTQPFSTWTDDGSSIFLSSMRNSSNNMYQHHQAATPGFDPSAFPGDYPIAVTHARQQSQQILHQPIMRPQPHVGLGTLSGASTHSAANHQPQPQINLQPAAPALQYISNSTGQNRTSQAGLQDAGLDFHGFQAGNASADSSYADCGWHLDEYGLAQPQAISNFQPQDASQSQAINKVHEYHQPSTPRNPQPSPNVAFMPSPVPFSYPPLDNMSGLHDSKPYLAHERDYPQIPDHDYESHDPQDGLPRYPSPPPPGLSENPYNTQQLVDATSDGRGDMADGRMDSSPPTSPGRSKPVPKPQREVTRLENGRFCCDWAGCTEEIKDFGRKCEWSKHMDKHDRPYKCPAEGCEKLPGFTYSGGLLRHEREVHNKHGGPRKQLNCPHENCKRHTGKGFSRQENLNEHLRRVHTGGTPPLHNGEDTEEDGGEARAGQKRKRTGRGNDEERDQEVAQLRQENQELRRQIEALTHQTTETMRQIMQLQQNQLNAGLQRLTAPPQMT